MVTAIQESWRGRSNPWTEHLWLYVLRTNQHFTLKQNRRNAEQTDTYRSRRSSGTNSMSELMRCSMRSP